jgi:peptidoglycan hydrolase CwlO-like protein
MKEILDNMEGKNNYEKYLKLLDAKKSIKNQGLVDDIDIDTKRMTISFQIQVMLSTFIVSVKDDKFNLNYRVGYDYFDDQYDTFDDVKDKIKDLIVSKLNEEIEEKQKEVNELNKNIEYDKKLISDVNKNI